MLERIGGAVAAIILKNKLRMTPKQYCFPYFFEQKLFNWQLEPFGLTSYIEYDKKLNMPLNLVITNKRLFGFVGKRRKLITIPCWNTLMISEDTLLYWKTHEDNIKITQVKLNSVEELDKTVSCEINLRELDAGIHKIETNIQVSNLVSFVRKSNIRYELDYYEKFAIVIINDSSINIIPFDWFNKKGGDYGYVWPATAKLSEGVLYGQGMRMNDFTLDLKEYF